MKVYIAGKITGDPNYRAKFEQAAETVRERTGGSAVILNPTTLPEGMNQEDYIRICLSMIDAADAVVFLQDWKASKGAGIEHEYSKYSGKEIYYL